MSTLLRPHPDASGRSRALPLVAGLVTLVLHAAVVVLLLRDAPPPRPTAVPKPIIVSLVEAPKPKAPEAVVEPPRPKPVMRPPVPPKPPVPRQKAPAPQPKRPAPVTEATPTPAPPAETPIVASPAPAATATREAPAPAPVAPAPVVAEAPPAPPPPVVEPRFDAAYLNNPAPSYPSVSRRLGEQGKVLLRVHVDEHGMPTSVVVRTTSGYERLDTVALETVRRWKFVPARRGNEPVSAYVIVPIVFNLRS